MPRPIKPAAMRHTFGFAACVAAALLAGAAGAAELPAFSGKSIELKNVRGLVYFVPKGEVFEVVTTLDSDGHVFRVVSSLKDGQSTVLSAPGAEGEAAAAVEIRREGDRLRVIDAARRDHAEAMASDGPRAN